MDIYVFSFCGYLCKAFCESSLPPQDKTNKKTLDEVHTYAELKHDPLASLPYSFTICSNLMTAGCLVLQHLGQQHGSGRIHSQWLLAMAFKKYAQDEVQSSGHPNDNW